MVKLVPWPCRFISGRKPVTEVFLMEIIEYKTDEANRCFAASVALGGAIFLAWHGKEGWGWLIFAGIVLGGISVSGD